MIRPLSRPMMLNVLRPAAHLSAWAALLKFPSSKIMVALELPSPLLPSEGASR